MFDAVKHVKKERNGSQHDLGLRNRGTEELDDCYG